MGIKGTPFAVVITIGGGGATPPALVPVHALPALSEPAPAASALPDDADVVGTAFMGMGVGITDGGGCINIVGVLQAWRGSGGGVI